MVDEKGELGSKNSFSAIGLEHKLGIHGSPNMCNGISVLLRVG